MKFSFRYSINHTTIRFMEKLYITYFLPRDIIPYIIPVVNIKPLPNILPIPGHRKTAGNAILDQ